MRTLTPRTLQTVSRAARTASTVLSLWMLVWLVLVPADAPTARAQTTGDSLYAVLWCGNSDYTPYVNDMKFAFQTLVNDYGYAKENILVLLKGGSYYDGDDLDGDNLGDIDFAATAANIDTAFARLARVVTQGDVVFLYCTDHGYYEETDCNDAGLRGYDWDDDLVSEENLAVYLGRLDTATRRVTKIVLFNTCEAGGMIPELEDLSAPLMIATASKTCEAAHYDDGGCHHAPTSCWYSAYSYWWFTAMHGSNPAETFSSTADANNDGYVTIKEASDYAKSADEFAQDDASPKEHPLFYDKNCMAGTIMTLGGRLPNLPKVIAFPYPCHEPFPCRWRGWGCTGIGPMFSSADTPVIRRSEEPLSTTLWTDDEPSPGETTYVYAKVCNTGDAPITSSTVSFYYADPTLSLVFPQTGLSDLGTEYAPFLPPHDSLVVGPVPFVPPAANSFGEPHWTLMAIAENYESPMGTGWLEDDDHVAATNRFELAASPGEPRSIHLAAQNPLDVPVKALLSIDDAALPPGWTAVLSPAAGDTIEIGPDSAIPVELTLTGVGGPIREGFVDISMALNTPTASECGSCDDTTCGGYIGEAGGCSVKLVVDGPVALFVPDFDVSATALGITVSWRADATQENLGFNVYRCEKAVGRFDRLNEAPIRGAGQLSFVDHSALPGTIYLYEIGVFDGETERFSAAKEGSLVQALDFELEQNFPNPFNPTTTISFTLPEKTHVRLAIYDVEGRLVRTLVECDLDLGVKTFEWNGEDSKGHAVTSGLYFYRLDAGNRSVTKKMALLK